MCKVFLFTPGTIEDCVSNLRFFIYILSLFVNTFSDGNLLIIAPGGVREALFSSADRYELMWGTFNYWRNCLTRILGQRMGFAKVILGANVVSKKCGNFICKLIFYFSLWYRCLLRTAEMPSGHLDGGENYLDGSTRRQDSLSVPFMEVFQ
jgi:hypothetical protein